MSRTYRNVSNCNMFRSFRHKSNYITEQVALSELQEYFHENIHIVKINRVISRANPSSNKIENPYNDLSNSAAKQVNWQYKLARKLFKEKMGYDIFDLRSVYNYTTRHYILKDILNESFSHRSWKKNKSKGI